MAADNEKIKYLVADTTAFINHVPLNNYAEEIFTVPDVINEVKNKRQIRRLCVIPYDLKVREPHTDNMAYVTNYSKRTGDYASLSAIDLKVIALTYELHKEYLGTNNLRSEPAELKVVASKQKPEELNDKTKLVGFFIPKRNRTSTTSTDDNENKTEAEEEMVQSNEKQEIKNLEDKIKTKEVVGLNETEDEIKTIETIELEEKEQIKNLKDKIETKEIIGLNEKKELKNIKDDIDETNKTESNEKEDKKSLENEKDKNDKGGSDISEDNSKFDDESWLEDDFVKECLKQLTFEESIAICDKLTAVDEEYERDMNELLANSYKSEVKDDNDDGDDDDENDDNNIGKNNDSDDVDSDEGHDSHENDGSDDSDYDDDDDNIAWITPSNIEKIKKTMTDNVEEEIVPVVACMSTDFAIQNVLKQINLNICALNGRIIKHVRTYILRCYACFKTTSIITKKFCPNCGNSTLKKVAVSLDEDGKQVIHINTKRPLTAKYKNQSLPRFQGGKHSRNPIICEDQPIPKQMPSRVAKTKTNALDEDYTAGFSPFVTRDVDSKSALLRSKGNIKEWAKNNTFEENRRKKRFNRLVK